MSYNLKFSGLTCVNYRKRKDPKPHFRSHQGHVSLVPNFVGLSKSLVIDLGSGTRSFCRLRYMSYRVSDFIGCDLQTPKTRTQVS